MLQSSIRQIVSASGDLHQQALRQELLSKKILAKKISFICPVGKISNLSGETIF